MARSVPRATHRDNHDYRPSLRQRTRHRVSASRAAGRDPQAVEDGMSVSLAADPLDRFTPWFDEDSVGRNERVISLLLMHAMETT